ncbi:MAG TPA: pyridoxamine 5'-phosphate oxidase family protein [Methanospirillum sp.]|nr:pyridoxamine 5'-phosphate oxidase family protein [Methanospirillum sp.]
MRRSDKEILDPDWIDSVLTGASYGHIALCDAGSPYLVQMNFAWSEDKPILHSAREGEKIRILRTNPDIAFTAETGVDMVTDTNPCEYGMCYRSVSGRGIARFVEDPDEKERLLSVLAEKYTGKKVTGFSKKAVQQVEVIEVTFTSLTGKVSGYPR